VALPDALSVTPLVTFAIESIFGFALRVQFHPAVIATRLARKSRDTYLLRRRRSTIERKWRIQLHTVS
jgi:hypothetical protein